MSLWHCEAHGLTGPMACCSRASRVASIGAVDTFPAPCKFCGLQIDDESDTEWHGLGNCVNICETCWCSGEIPDLESAAADSKPCAACEGRGWFPMLPQADGDRR